MNLKIRKISEQLGNTYYPIGQKGNEYGGNADQESEVAEELNEEMEARDMEGFTPGNDNLIIDKNQMNDAIAVAELERLAILLKQGYAKDLLNAAIERIKRKV